MGAQCYTSRPQNDTINPKWNFSCQFFIKDLYQDVLCITVFERDQFSPDGKCTDTPEKKSICYHSIFYLFSRISSFINIDAYYTVHIQVYCICVFSDFLGRTEVPVATIKKDQDGKGPLTRRLLLHEVPTGEVRVRLDLQLYEQTPLL